MTPALQTALSQRQVRLCGLIEIMLSDHVIRLCDGSAVVQFDGYSFSGRDATYGVLGEVEAVSEATGDTVPGVEMTMIPPSLTAAVSLSYAGVDAPVRIWLAAVDDLTGVVVPDPELIFAGEIDTLAVEQDRSDLRVAISVASVFERLLEPDEAVLMSDTFHQGIWPGETGFAQMTGTPISDIWGPGDRPPAVTIAPQVPQGGANRYF